MFERLAATSGRNIGFRISGVLTGDETKAILIPELDRAITTYGYVHLLLQIDRLERVTLEALIEDLKASPLVRQIKRLAVVGDSPTEALATALAGMLLPLADTDTDVHYFRPGQCQEAWDWLHRGGAGSDPDTSAHS